MATQTATPTPTTAPRPKRRKRIVVGVAALIVAAASVGAYAYWTTTGSGTGSASTGDVDPVTLTQTSVVADLAPGSGTQALSGVYDSPNDGPVRIATITVAITDVVDADGDSLGAACDADDYTIAGSPITVNAEIEDGDAWSGATIAFNNKANANQDACKGATVELSYTAN